MPLLESFKNLSYQEKVLYGAASIIALMLIFPPTKKYNISEFYPYSTTLTTSYDYIFSLPNGAFVNIQVLLLQWLGVGLVAAILYFAASKKSVSN
ncbi:MAG: hypothetical protein ACREDM_09845 [Methylocella sp.]